MFFPAALRATFPENWPEPLKEKAAACVEIPLTFEDVTVLGHFNGYYMQHFEFSGHEALSDETQEAIQSGLAKLPAGVMPRLGLCSWKGSTLVHAPAKTFGDVMQLITQDDLRVGRALASSAVAQEGAVLHLREWVDIPEWSEFRVFVHCSQIKGISQYFHRRRYAEITENITEINAVLFEFCASILPVLPLETVVIDVHLKRLPASPLTPADVALIELNPYAEGTDPCLFSWSDPDGFDGNLRYVS